MNWRLLAGRKMGVVVPSEPVNMIHREEETKRSMPATTSTS